MRAFSLSDKILKTFNVLILFLISLSMLIPLVTVAARSFSSGAAVNADSVYLLPVGFNLESWKAIIFSTGAATNLKLWNSFFITLSTTVAGTFACLFITSIFAYALSKKEFKAGKYLMLAIVVIMVFKAPVIPYFLTVKGIGLYNNILVLIIPHLVSAYNLIIMRTFFQQFPVELEEAAQIEGCGYFRIFFNFVIPNSKAVLSTIGLFYAVGLWNQFTNALYFIQNPLLFPLQIKLRMLSAVSTEASMSYISSELIYNEVTIRAAVILFAIIPILIVYPYLQKYFVKGAMLGSVKG